MQLHPSVKNKLELEIFETLELSLKELHHREYYYDKATFKGLNKVISITCVEHGNFRMTPVEHGLPMGCPKCSTKPIKKPVDGTSRFKEKMRLRYDTQFDLENIKYVNQQTPITLTCKKHGDFQRTPKQLLYSYACPDCRVPHVPKTKGNLTRTEAGPTLVYFVYFPSIDKYKAGLVSIKVGMEKRFRKSGYPEYELLESWLLNTGKAAEEYLNKLLTENADNLYAGPNLLQTGNTELFNINILKD